MPRQISSSIIQSLPKESRRIRRPQHPFFTRQRPWQLQPMLIAPVLPGETMRNLLLQARVLTDPLAHSLSGWWCEFYFFYVKHRDLDDRDTYTQMMLDVSDVAPGEETANAQHYYRGGSGSTKHNWVEKCLEVVVREYFRNEGETEPSDIDGLPPVALNDQSFLDSAVLTDTLTSVDTTLVDEAGSGTLTASELDDAMRNWEFLRLSNLTQMSYEDYLASYGVRPTLTEIHRPELIRYVRQWTYPASVVDPTSGVANSVASWAIAERADKDRYFPEPGFIFGLCCVRPKVFRGNQLGTAVSSMVDALSWLPGILDRTDPRLGLRTEANATTGLADITDANGWVWDVRDLFLYGDQFVNVANPDTNFDDAAGLWPSVDLPDATLQKRYATIFDAVSFNLFKNPGSWSDETPSFPGEWTQGSSWVRFDGVVSLSIASSTRDVSPSTYTHTP